MDDAATELLARDQVESPPGVHCSSELIASAFAARQVFRSDFRGDALGDSRGSFAVGSSCCSSATCASSGASVGAGFAFSAACVFAACLFASSIGATARSTVCFASAVRLYLQLSACAGRGVGAGPARGSPAPVALAATRPRDAAELRLTRRAGRALVRGRTLRPVTTWELIG